MTDYQIIKMSNDDGNGEFVNLKGVWAPEIINILKNTSVSELCLNIALPDFIALQPIANKIIRLIIDMPEANSDGLEKFTEVKDLLIDSATKRSFKLPKFNKLEKASVLWYKKYSDDFLKSPNLNNLKLQNFDEQDCSMISIANKLEHLKLLGCKILTINGLQNLKHLKCLTIAYAKKLENIDAFCKFNQLESLYIESCSKINDLSPIKELKALKRLHIEKVKVGFNDIDWVADMPELNYVLNEAEVAQINWETVFNNHSIKEFATRTHEGYVITDDELVSLAVKLGRKIKIIERFPPKKTPMISIEFDD
jgi:hypothetical protein